MIERSLRAYLAGRGQPTGQDQHGYRSLGERLRGGLADGWTALDITRVATDLAPTGQRLMCVWEYADAIGPNGHASLGIMVPAAGDVLRAPVHAVADWVWDWLVESQEPEWGPWVDDATPLLLSDTQPRFGWDTHNVVLDARP